MGDDRGLWDREYGTLQVIPSSTRTSPSKALVLFSELLGFEGFDRVLDAGCGPGRNSIYLAKKGCKVDAVDFSETALSELRTTAGTEGVREKVSIHSHTLEEPLPLPENSFDFVLDSYVFCHFLDDSLKCTYRSELHRLTKPGGLVFVSLFSFEDEYYKRILESGNKDSDVIIDPNNGVTKQLYTEEQMKTFFGTMFKIKYFVKYEFNDMVLEQPYLRSVLITILEK